MLENDLYEIIGDRIAKRRSVLEKTQEQLSKILGISRASLANIEAGRQRLSVHQLYNTASALQIGINELLPEMDKVRFEPLISMEIHSVEKLTVKDKNLVREALAQIVARKNNVQDHECET